MTTMKRCKQFGPIQLGCQISRAREDAELSQAELGRRLSVPRQHVFRWEVGSGSPGSLRLREIAVALDCTTDSLLGLDVAEKKLKNSHRKC